MRGNSGQPSRIFATGSPTKHRNRLRYRGDANMISCHLLQTCTRDCHSFILLLGSSSSSGHNKQNANIFRRTSSGRVSMVSVDSSQRSPVQPHFSTQDLCEENQKHTISASHSSFWKSVLWWWVWAGTMV